MVDWVERNRAPESLVGTAPAGTPWPGRTRPLCAYPEQARYQGEGSIEDAVNFSCNAPRDDHDDWPHRGKSRHPHDDDD